MSSFLTFNKHVASQASPGRQMAVLQPRALLLLLTVLLASACPKVSAQGGGSGARISSFLTSNRVAMEQGADKVSSGRHMAALQSGECRLFRFNAPSLQKFQMRLSATSPFGTYSWGPQYDLNRQPTAPECPPGAWLMAAVYREDQLPEGLLPPMRISKAAAPDWAPVAQLLTVGCKVSRTSTNTSQQALLANNAIPLSLLDDANGADNRTCSFSSLFASQKERTTTVPKNETELFEAYHVFPGTQCRSTIPGSVGEDLVIKKLFWPHESFLNNRSGLFKTEDVPRLLGSANETDDESIKKAFEAWCGLMSADFNSPLLNISLLPEPAEICTEFTADMYVYVRNCFVPQDVYLEPEDDPGLLLAHVTLDPLPEDNNSTCLSKLDDTVEVLNKKVLLALLVGYSGFVLLLAGVSYCMVHRNSKAKDKIKDMEADPNAKSHTLFQRLYLALNTIQSASGYCRCYTIAVTTSAALLIAMIVWQPRLDPKASYDHAYYDYPYAPVQKDGAKYKIPYYLKIMGISALYGFVIRVALCSNQGFPDLKRRGAAAHGFNKRVWKIQVFLSTLALLILGITVAAFILWAGSVWVALDVSTKVPYTYLMVALGVNYATALVFFVVHTFIKPPRPPRPGAASAIRDMPTTADHSTSRASELGEAEGGSQINGVISAFWASIREEGDFRYSAWILTPLWLSALLMVFWFLSGVMASKQWEECVKNPSDCVGNKVAPWMKTLDAYVGTTWVQSLAQRFKADDQQTMQQIATVTNSTVEAFREILATLRNQNPPIAPEALQAIEASLNATKYNITSIYDTLRSSYMQSIEFYDCMQDIAKPLEHYLKSAEIAYTVARWLGHGLATIFAVISLINILQTFKRVLAHQHSSSSADLIGAVPSKGCTDDEGCLIQDSAAPSSTRHGHGEERGTQFATTEIMQTIQTLEMDMQRVGIGASVTLFGVLVSTMWIQVRIIGFVFTIAITVLLHPLFWTYGMAKWWPSIIALLILVLFNMVIVKILIGNRLLSDGTRVKHAGLFMTYFLCFQLGFLVVGVLYASWRVVWALIITLLYSVACLDRSILLIGKCLDGPYTTFVGSIKLEHAWGHIHERYTPPPATKSPNKGILACFPCCASPTTAGDSDMTVLPASSNVSSKEGAV